MPIGVSLMRELDRLQPEIEELRKLAVGRRLGRTREAFPEAWPILGI